MLSILNQQQQHYLRAYFIKNCNERDYQNWRGAWWVHGIGYKMTQRSTHSFFCILSGVMEGGAIVHNNLLPLSHTTAYY